MAAALDANLGVNDYTSGAPITRVLTTTGTAASGTLIVVAVSWFGAQTVTGVSDGSAYTLAKAATNGNDRVSIYYRYATTGLASGSSITVSISGSLSGAMLIGAASFTGITTTSQLDASSGSANGTGASASSGAATNSQADSLYVGAIGIEDPTNPTTGTATNGTEIHDRYRSADQQGIWTGYLAVSTIASRAITATLSNSNSTANTGALAIFNAISGGGSPAPRPLGTLGVGT